MEKKQHYNLFSETRHSTIKIFPIIDGLTYSSFKKIGHGTFGTVFRCICDQTNETLSIKSVFQDPRYKNRELGILLLLNHINIIHIKNYFYTEKADIYEENTILNGTTSNIEGENTINNKIKNSVNITNDNNDINNFLRKNSIYDTKNLIASKNSITPEKYLNIVMDYFPYNLSEFIQKHSFISITPMSILDFKIYCFQMFHGLNYLHCIGVCHRDIKPHNILLNDENKKLVFCDFGSAKKLIKNEPNISYVCSRYYRAPELIFNSQFYNDKVDIWGVGCCICEMIIGEPLFKGKSSIEQIVEIIKLLGTPNKKDIHSMNPNYNIYKFPLIKCFTIKEAFKNVLHSIPENFFDLITKILIYNPKKRISPLEAMAHPFFDDLRDENNVISDNLNNILFYSFNNEEFEHDRNHLIFNKIIPDWAVEKNLLLQKAKKIYSGS